MNHLDLYAYSTQHKMYFSAAVKLWKSINRMTASQSAAKLFPPENPTRPQTNSIQAETAELQGRQRCTLPTAPTRGNTLRQLPRKEPRIGKAKRLPHACADVMLQQPSKLFVCFLQTRIKIDSSPITGGHCASLKISEVNVCRIY